MSSLLGLRPSLLQAGVAILVFLGPVYFAGLVFARLIMEEPSLPSAYGSNLLVAVIGGCCEYLSVLIGLKALLLLTAVFYVVAWMALGGRRRAVQLA